MVDESAGFMDTASRTCRKWHVSAWCVRSERFVRRALALTLALALTRTCLDAASRTSKDSSSVPQPSTSPGFSVSRVSLPLATSHRYMSKHAGLRLLMPTSSWSGKRLFVITFCALAPLYGLGLGLGQWRVRAVEG